MIIIYLGSFVNYSLQDFLLNGGTTITTSATTFQRALVDGFTPSHKYKIFIVNAADVGSFPKRSKRIWIPGGTSIENGIDCINCSYLNLTYLKQYDIKRKLIYQLDRICKDYPHEKIVIVVYSLIYAYIKAAITIKKQFKNVKVVPIILDLPEYFSDNTDRLSRLLSHNSRIKSLYKFFDGGIVLTPQMVRNVDLINKPTLLLEGIYRPLKEDTRYLRIPKTILYSGKLDSRFGIDILLKAFRMIDDSEFQLWIYGDGSARKLVEEATKKDSRIKFFGYRNQYEIFDAQRKVSLLINPRQNIGEYTKYSFPSKTMEYLASGTPTIMYKLDGIPEEYNKYLIYPSTNSPEDLAQLIMEWSNKSISDLEKFGEQAKEFILNNKTSKIQAKRLIDFILEHYG